MPSLPLRRASTAASPHHFSSPASNPRLRQLDHAAAISLSPPPSVHDTASTMGRQDFQSGEQKFLNSLVGRLVNKLPCNSGTPLTILESDAAVQSTVQSLLQLSRIKLSLVVQSLTNALETLSRYGANATSVSDIPLDVLHSQLYILHVLSLCLSTSWRIHSQVSPPPPSDLPRCWPDPYAFEDNLARHLLSVMLVYTRMVSIDTDFAEVAGGQQIRDTRNAGATSSSSWAKSVSTASNSYSLGAKFLKEHAYPSSSQTSPPDSHQNRQLHSSCADVPAVLTQMTKLTARIVFYLSSSNWPLVFSQIRKRITYLTTTIEDSPEMTDLRLLEWINVDQARLAQVLRDVTSTFLHIKRPAQITAATMLRRAILNWINIHPVEYESLIDSGRKLEGSPDALFDVLYTMSDLGSSSAAKRTKAFYPLMAMLLVLCPDTLKRVVMGDSIRGSSSYSKKASFLESFKKGLNSTKGFEACAVCYVDLMKAGMALSPRMDTSGIRGLVPEIQNDLKNALFYSSLSGEISDENVLVDGLVALYRYNPTMAGGPLFRKLWNDSSDVSKIIAVKACIVIAIEGSRLPWHPSLDDLMREVSPAIRNTVRTHTVAPAADKFAPRRPRGSIELPSGLSDLTLEIMSLYSIEPLFAFAGLRIDSGQTSSDSILSLFQSLSTLLVIPSPEVLRTAASRTNAALISHLRELCHHNDKMRALASDAAEGIWQMLLDTGRQMLFAFHGGTAEEVTASANTMREISGAIIGFAEDHFSILFPCLKAQPAVMIISAAGFVVVVSPDVEQTTLTLPTLSALAKLTRMAHRSAAGTLMTSAYSDKPDSRATAFDVLATLPIPIGRQQQQKLIRRSLRPLAVGTTLTCSVWVGLLSIWKDLTAKIITASSGRSISTRDRRRVMTADIEGLGVEESKEWQNLTSFLCAIAGVGIYQQKPNSLSSVVGSQGLLPETYEEDISDFLPFVEGFIKQCVELLLNNSVTVRESVKASLGSELPTSMARYMIAQMAKIVLNAFLPSGHIVSEQFTTLVEQTVTTLRLLVDRLGPEDDSPSVQIEMGEILCLLGQYIQRLGRTDRALRLKIRYCQLIEAALAKKDNVVTENGAKFKNAALDWMAEWSLEIIRDDSQTIEMENTEKLQREVDRACLRATVPLSENLVLVLRQGENEPEDPQGVLKSRLFYRHYTHLVSVIERSDFGEEGSSNRPASMFGQIKSAGPDDEPTFAILALSNLLSANIDVGLEHCLSLGYHEDPALRTVFMQLLINILQQGTRFGGLATKTISHAPKLYLECLSSSNLALALAMVDVCPQSGPEVEELSTLLFRVFEGRGTLLSLMKVLIEREVAITNHESELFRANSITMRMITIFAKMYGYNYVRATLQPLISSLAEKPDACSFELDPRKAAPGDDIEDNADRLRLMCQALLDIICSSTPHVPLMFRSLCHHIWDVVDDRFPESRHSAIGSFIFLRFFCPAIVSPDAIDLDVKPDTRETRRALLLITKVIQNLANNVMFKEPHMKVLNPFLLENIQQVTKFLSDIAIRPKSADVQKAVNGFQEDAERNQDPEGDDTIIQGFVFKHKAKLEISLTSMPKSFRHNASSSKLARTDLDGQTCLERLKKVMDTTGQQPDMTIHGAVAKAQAYQEFMKNHQGRNTDSVKEVFYEGPSSENGRRLFYYVVARVALIDYDLLAYHVFQSLNGITEYYDVIIDLTEFSSATELPLSWLKRAIQMCPSSIMTCLHTLVFYNPNTYAHKRLKRLIAELLTISHPVGKNVVAVSNPEDLEEHIRFTELALPSRTMDLAYAAEVFSNMTCLSDHGMQVPVFLKLDQDCFQIASWRRHDLTPNIKSFIIDVLKLSDIDDIITPNTPPEQLIIKYSQSETLTLITKQRNEIALSFRTARARLRDAPVNSRVLRPSDVPATLLNVALLNLTSSSEALRMGAYILVHELSHFFKYDLASRVLKVSAGLTIPNNSLAWVYALSKALAESAPHLTVEFLKEWTIGFSRADVPLKAASLHYVGPWLTNLDRFSRPTREDSIESIKQVREIIRSFLSVTVAERLRLHLSIQQHIWTALAKSHDSLVDLMIYELIHAAIEAGLGSDKLECVADALVSISSTNVRGKVVARLRKTLARTYVRPSNHLTEHATWNEVCALARLALVLGFNPTSSMDTQLFLPEIFHVITLLLGVGPLMMRQTVYGLLVSILNSLASNATSGEMNAAGLARLSRKLQEPAMMTAFGLTQGQGRIQLSALPDHDVTDLRLLDRVEEVSKFLGEVLVAGAISVDCANAWRARWMGLVAATCFQHNPAAQPQAFTVLGYLSTKQVDDDLIYQILTSISAALKNFTEGDSVLVISMLRCSSRITPGLLSNGRYDYSLFWLAVAVLELGFIPLFAPALELMVTALQSIFKNGLGMSKTALVESVLDARTPLGEDAKKLDQVAGVSFETDFAFALVCIVIKGVRHPSTRKLTIESLFELLRLTASPIRDGGEGPLVGGGSVAFFVALLSIVANSGEEAKKVFEAAGLVVNTNSVDLAPISVFDLLVIPDNSTALLLISFVVALLSGSSGSDSEKVVLYKLLADASTEIPEVLSMAYDTLIPRIVSTLSTTSNTAIIRSSTIILERALSDNNYTFPNFSAIPSTDSSTSLQHAGHNKAYASSISSNPSMGGAREQMLEDLGMKALGDLSFPPVKFDRLAMMAKWVASMLDTYTN